MSDAHNYAELQFPYSEPPATGTTIEVAPGILWTRIPLPFRLDHVNVYLIRDGEGWAIFDTGIDSEEARHVWDSLLNGPLANQKITRLLVSHAHPDHIGLAGWLCDRLGIPLLTSQTSYLTCINVTSNPDSMEAHQYRDFYLRHGMAPETAEGVGSQGHEYLSMVSPLPLSFMRLVAGDVLRIGDREFAVLSGDGHAPEQIMLHSLSDKILLVADQVIAKITPNVSVWAVEPDGDPLGLYLRSLAKLEKEIPQDVLVLPGHQMPFFGLHARCRELIRHHHNRCELILSSCLKHPQTVADLVPVLFTRTLDPHQLGFAFSETHAHVNYLLRQGKLRSNTEKFNIVFEAVGMFREATA